MTYLEFLLLVVIQFVIFRTSTCIIIWYKKDGLRRNEFVSQFVNVGRTVNLALTDIYVFTFFVIASTFTLHTLHLVLFLFTKFSRSRAQRAVEDYFVPQRPEEEAEPSESTTRTVIRDASEELSTLHSNKKAILLFSEACNYLQTIKDNEEIYKMVQRDIKKYELTNAFIHIGHELESKKFQEQSGSSKNVRIKFDSKSDMF